MAVCLTNHETVLVHSFEAPLFCKEMEMIFVLDKQCSIKPSRKSDAVFFISPQMDNRDTVVRVWRSFLPGNYNVEWSKVLSEHVFVHYKGYTCFLDTSTTLQKWFYHEYTKVKGIEAVNLNSIEPKTTYYHPIILVRKNNNVWTTEVLSSCE